MNYKLLTTVAVAGLALAAQSGKALASDVLVSTIDGSYDDTTVGPYDTPSLKISNTTNYSFSNVTLTLTPYQPGTDTYGLAPQTRTFGDIAANSVSAIVWLDGYGSVIQGDLWSYDYDDSYGQTTTNAACAAQPYAICSDVGNFQVTFTAIWNNPDYGPGGTEVASVFSPTHNATGGFVGWEGLDPNGWSESTYDDHLGTPNGVLANIYVGTPDTIPSGAPEPATWALSIMGLGLVGASLRRRRTAAATA